MDVSRSKICSSFAISVRWLPMLILLLVTISPAYAAYEVDKVRLFLSLSKPVDTLKVSNPGGKDKPVSLQTRLMRWTQKNGQDVYEPSNDLIVSPPMMRIPPKRTQLLRVGWRAPTPIQTEKAYRLYMQDISPFTPLSETGVRVKIKLGVPIFILPAAPIYRLNWKVDSLSGKTLKMTANNVGNTHVQVAFATLTAPDNHKVGNYSGGAYIFPGESKQLTFTMTDTSIKNLKMSVDTDSAPMQVDIRIP